MNKKSTKSNIYWVGTRVSDIGPSDSLFIGSITIFGNNKMGNISFSCNNGIRVDHNKPNKELSQFFREAIKTVIKNNADAQFMFYNPTLAFNLKDLIGERFICANDLDLLRFLKNKIQTRLVFSNYVPTLSSKLFLGNKCTIDHLKDFFPNESTFVIQANTSSGGAGTFLLNESITPHLDPHQIYLVSPYYERSIPVNTHVIIYENDIIFLAPSVQLISLQSGKLLYMGADFSCYMEIQDDLQSKIKNYTLKIANHLQESGYRGIAGIDFLVTKDDALYLEVNGRFQASTVLINNSLKKIGERSVQELNKDAFENSTRHEGFCMEEIFSSCYSYLNVDSRNNHHDHIYNKANFSLPDYKIIDDGYKKGQECDKEAFLYRLICNSNIASITPDYSVIIHDNIIGSETIPTEIKLTELKFRILNQGVTIDDSAFTILNSLGEIKGAVFEAIDLTLYNGLKVNVPVNIKLTDLSPFNILGKDNKTWLTFYGKVLGEVKVAMKDNLSMQKTKSGVPFSSISTLITDRVRINYEDVCSLIKNNVACKFCNLPTSGISYSMNDINEVIDAYLDRDNFRHFLIGGGTGTGKSGWNKVLKIAKYIRGKSDKPIYLMSLPPSNVDMLNKLWEAGITEVGFNIEVFDRKIAVELMPSKGLITKEKYFEILEQSVKIWGNKGNVRSLVIVGLESKETLLAGIEELCSLGVSPILSIFRPLPNTSCQNIIPPNYTEIRKLYDEIRLISEKHNISLGPKCTDCQNNALVI